MRPVLTVVLLTLAAGLFVRPELANRLLGRVEIGSLDPASLSGDVPRSDLEDGGAALSERNLVRLVVPRDLTVAELLGLYGLDHPHVRRALALQEGRETLADDHLLRAGSTYRIFLAPPEP